MKLKGIFLALLLASPLLLPACSRQGNYTDNSAINNYSVRRGGDDTQDTTRAYQTQQLYGNVVHDNNHLFFNQYLSDQISAMYGIQSAIVMTTDKYAYAAITLDGTGLGTKGGNAKQEVNNQGTVTGIYNPHDPKNDGANPNDLATGVNNYDTVKDHNDLSHGIKQKIAQKIRSLQPSILDVYISANRDFINSMTNLAQESWKGKSLEPYVGNFNELVTKTFGTNQWTQDE